MMASSNGLAGASPTTRLLVLLRSMQRQDASKQGESATVATATVVGTPSSTVTAVLRASQNSVDGLPQSPRRKRRMGASNTVTEHFAADVMDATFAANDNTTVVLPAAAAGGTVIDGIAAAGDASEGAFGASAPDGDTAVAHAATDRSPSADATEAGAPSVPAPAADFLHGGKDFVNSTLNKPLLEPVSNAAGTSDAKKKKQARHEANLSELTCKGEECWSAIEEMRADGWARYNLETDNPGCQEQKASRNDIGSNNTSKTYMWKLSVVLNEGGQQITEEEWHRRSQDLEAVMTSYQAWDKAFELGLARSALGVKSIYREQTDRCHALNNKKGGVPGGGPYEVEVNEGSKGKMAAFRVAVFRVTAVMMLLWHSQGRAVHPSLQALVDKYKLKAVPVKRHKEQTNTAVMRGEASRALIDTGISKQKKQKSSAGCKRKARRRGDGDSDDNSVVAVMQGGRM